jgi:hypothetical protein
LLEAAQGTGTAFKVKYRGKEYWLSAAHVCAISPLFSLSRRDEEKRPPAVIAEPLKRNDKEDICVFKPIPGDTVLGRIPLDIGYEIRQHMDLFTAGYPNGLFYTSHGNVVYGPVAGYLYMTNLIVYPGSSGSPVIDKHGQLVGLVSGRVEGMTIAAIVSLTKIRKFLDNVSKGN